MKAIFLDRDGTINEDSVDYIKSSTEFKLFPYSAEAINMLRSLDYKIIIITNQSGIAKGLFTINDYLSVTNYMQDKLAEENAIIDLVLYSPYHPEGIVAPYNIEHNSRKPKPGMFYEAIQKYPIKASKSFMIGDKDIDIEFGKRNGLKTILVKTGYGRETWKNRKKIKIMPDFVVENILSAAFLITFLTT